MPINLLALSRPISGILPSLASTVYNLPLGVKGGDIFLEVGCCFGQVLRQLAHDGAPAQNIVGVDVKKGFVDLGYELFRDRESFAARIVIGDMLDTKDSALSALDGTVHLVHAASLFHLFNWDDQLKLGERIVPFFKRGLRML